MEHQPVLLEECVEILTGAGPGLFVDATLGPGGHAEALLAAHPAVRVLGIDRDPQALDIARRRLAPFGERVFFCAPTSPISATSSRGTRPAARGGY